MRHIDFENNIKPFSGFRAHTASFVKQIKDSKRPMILIQHSKTSAVLVVVAA
jgi:PHD/YefM family antitoxin component YafN of YafNO toxin-antitoxin module